MAILKKFLFCLPVILLLYSGTVRSQSQESVMTEVSYPFLNRLVDTAKKYYPKMRTFDHRVNIANGNIKKAKLSWFDLFTFSYLYSPSNSTTLVNPSFLNGYQFGIFFNISSFFVKPQNIRQARDELAITQLEREEYHLNLEAEVRMRYFKYVQELTLLKVMSQALVDADNAMKQVRHKFEKSEETFDNYNKSLLVYADRRQAVVIAEGAVLIAKSSLEELICRKLEEIN
jgi:outer membrane protein TolC